MKRNLSTILFLMLACTMYGQDTIKVFNESPIVAKIIEVNDQNVKYKKFSNLTGPDYLISRDKIERIIYKNGESESFSSRTDTRAYPELSTQYKAKTKQNSKVFLTGENQNAITHVTRALKDWGYWQIVQDKKKADFILEVNMNYAALGEVFTYAQFKNPSNGEVFLRTRNVSSGVTIDLNFKRAAMNKLVKEELMPMFR